MHQQQQQQHDEDRPVERPQVMSKCNVKVAINLIPKLNEELGKIWQDSLWFFLKLFQVVPNSFSVCHCLHASWKIYRCTKLTYSSNLVSVTNPLPYFEAGLKSDGAQHTLANCILCLLHTFLSRRAAAAYPLMYALQWLLANSKHFHFWSIKTYFAVLLIPLFLFHVLPTTPSYTWTYITATYLD